MSGAGWFVPEHKLHYGGDTIPATPLWQVMHELCYYILDMDLLGKVSKYDRLESFERVWKQAINKEEAKTTICFPEEGILRNAAEWYKAFEKAVKLLLDGLDRQLPTKNQNLGAYGRALMQRLGKIDKPFSSSASCPAGSSLTLAVSIRNEPPTSPVHDWHRNLALWTTCFLHARLRRI